MQTTFRAFCIIHEMREEYCAIPTDTFPEYYCQFQHTYVNKYNHEEYNLPESASCWVSSFGSTGCVGSLQFVVPNKTLARLGIQRGSSSPFAQESRVVCTIVSLCRCYVFPAQLYYLFASYRLLPLLLCIREKGKTIASPSPAKPYTTR